MFFSRATQSVGLLSYTFFAKNRARDDVIVPMVILYVLNA